MSLTQAPNYEKLPAHASAMRQAVRSFLDERLKAVPADQRARSWMGFDADFSRAMAARGWVGLTLPKIYGGGELDPFCRFVIVEEMLAAGAPVSAHWIADRQSGPLINKYGTESQKFFYLPKICSAEAFFCIGMSEPESGSDLVSIRTRAIPNAAGWQLSGQKVWTTNADKSRYMIALVRTSGTAQDRHQGLSQIIIDLHSPGITIRSIEDLTGAAHFNEVFFDNVQLPQEALIGAEGAGWAQVTAELAFERSGPERIYSSVVLLDTWLQYLRKHTAQTQALPATLSRLVGRIVSQLAVLRAMSVSTTALLATGGCPVLEAALVKDLGTQLEQDIAQWIAEAIGSEELPEPDDELMRTLAYVTQIAPSYSLRGGTREILRGMIARGLGLR
jgi:alkylation response protein AidB-like acyl-CoA dehydrogenase